MRLKYCGFQTASDVNNAIDLPIDAIGFILYEKSKRCITLEQLKRLTAMIPLHIDRVAVVVNLDIDTLVTIATTTDVNTIQFHGDETPEEIRQFKQRCPDIQCTKALPADQQLHTNIARFAPEVAYFVIDTPSKHYGGTGQPFDWTYLTQLPETVDYIVAGGMNSERIQTLMANEIKCNGFDVASGIENKTGNKSRCEMVNIARTVKKGMERYE